MDRVKIFVCKRVCVCVCVCLMDARKRVFLCVDVRTRAVDGRTRAVDGRTRAVDLCVWCSKHMCVCV